MTNAELSNFSEDQASELPRWTREWKNVKAEREAREEYEQ